MPNDKKDKAQEMDTLGRDVDTLGRDVDRLMLQQKNAIEKITGVMDACKKESLLEGVSDDELACLEAYCSDMMNAVTVARKLAANLIEAYKSKVPKLDIAKKKCDEYDRLSSEGLLRLGGDRRSVTIPDRYHCIA